MRLAELADKRVAIWGYGREGRAALSALRKYFPDKQLSLICSAAEGESARALGDAKLSIITGVADAATLARFDVIVKSPGISPYKLPVPEAERAGVCFTSGTALWFAERSDARTICVTGTKGKSTVTALIAHLLRKEGLCVALAGNIGLPLLELLDVGGLNQPPEPDWWVIELSSFQTRDFDGAPTVAVINNLYEEHLDWHGTRENYAADKLAIATHAQRLVVGTQAQVLAATATHPARSVFGVTDGWHVRDDAIWRGERRILQLASIPMPGLHNSQNVCAALAAIDTAGMDARSMATHVSTFRALPHRLQSLGVHDELEYINDSISTTPYASIEALRSLTGRAVTVLVGGFDRGVDWGIFVDYVSKYPPHAVVTMGANGVAIANALHRIASPGFVLECAESLDAAVARARALTVANGAILLSPGAPSFDQFRDYAERGREFARLAGFDPAAIAQIEGLGIA
jgi:UDP-N-acetylmuramoylalanine--D-glutamate ligase